MHSFNDYLKANFTAEEIAVMQREVELEIAAIEATKAMQAKISQTMQQYMSQEKINIDQFGQRVGLSASKIGKILNGKVNVNLSTIAQLAIKIGHTPQLTI